MAVVPPLTLVVSNMDPDEYQKMAERTECDQQASLGRMLTHHPQSIRVNHAIIGLAGEVGELASLLQKWIYYGQDLKVEGMKEEIGDCLWYLAELCNAMGFSLGKIMQANIQKLKIRYPDKYSDTQALQRDTCKEQQLFHQGTQVISKKPQDAPKNRTRSEVLKLRNTVMGCCDQFANNNACTCLEDAIDVRTKYCCECGDTYPHQDLQDGWIYCVNCRCTRDQKYPHDWRTIQTAPGSGLKCIRCGLTKPE